MAGLEAMVVCAGPQGKIPLSPPSVDHNPFLLLTRFSDTDILASHNNT